MTPERITELALSNGFKLKAQPDGSEALNPYVFDFAKALIAAHEAAKPKGYRLLEHGEMIREGDEFMDDDTVTWCIVRKGFCGHPWGGAWQPMRRAMLEAAPDAQPHTGPHHVAQLNSH